MIIVMNSKASDSDVKNVVQRIEKNGLSVHLSRGTYRTIIGIIGDKKQIAELPINAFTGVEKVIHVTESYKLVSREFKNEDTIVNVDGVEVGGSNFVVMAGPCAVESREQLLEAAIAVKAAGAQFLRGGAFKPRTSPYSFQGLKEEGLVMLAETRAQTGLKIVTEVVDISDVDVVSKYVDVLQIGARNMQNYQLLKAVGRAGRPVLLKRGLAATIDEWLNAAEYVMSEGNYQVILCERGIRTFETYTRNTLDLSAVAAIKRISHLPVIVDPSHATGTWKLVGSMSRAAVATGADGLMIEVHPHPEEALSDGPQSLTPENFRIVMGEIKKIAAVMDRQFV